MNDSGIIREIRKADEDRSCGTFSGPGEKKCGLAETDLNSRFSRSFKPLDGVLRHPREASRAFARNAGLPPLLARGGCAHRPSAAGQDDKDSIGAVLFGQQNGLTGFP
jgi:hypothetical protein